MKNKEKMNNEPIMFSKNDESLKMNVEKKSQDVSREIVVDDEAEAAAAAQEDVIEKVESKSLGIAPKHIKEYEIKKPEEKEPSLLKMISDKLKGNEGQKINTELPQKENIDKLKPIVMTQGNK